MTLKHSACLLLTASIYLALSLPTAHAGCLPKAVVEKYGLYQGCPEGNTIKVTQGSKHGYITPQGQVIADFIYDDARDFDQGLASVAIWDTKSSNYLWGAIDEAGNEVIELQYENPLNFSEGLALVKKDNAVGYIDRHGKQVIDYKYHRASSFDNGRAIVDYSDFQEIINMRGEVLLPAAPVSLSALNERLLLRETRNANDAPEIIDINNQVYHKKEVYINPIISIKKTAANLYDKYRGEGTLWYMLKPDGYVAKSYELMNNEGEIVFKDLVMPEDEKLTTIDGLTVINTGVQLQVIDAQGKIRLSGKFDSINPVIEDDLAIVRQGDQYYYYRLQAAALSPSNTIHSNAIGQLAFEKSFDRVGLFSEGLAFAEQGEWRGLIDKSGHRVTQVPYEQVSIFHKDNAIYSATDNKYGVMNRQGVTVIPAIYNRISYCGEHFIVEDIAFGLVDHQGQKVIEAVYDNIDCHDNFVVTHTNLKTLSFDKSLLYLDTGKFYPHKIARFDKMKNGYATLMVNKDDQSEDDLAFSGFIDKAGKVTLIGKRKFRLDNLGQGFFLDNQVNKVPELINNKGETIHTKGYSEFYPVVHGYIPVRKNDVWGVIDTHGKEIFPPSYEDLKVLGDDLFIVEKKRGVINKLGEDVVPPIYDDIDLLSNGFIIVMRDLNWRKEFGVLNANLEFILPLEYSEINYLEDDRFAVKKEEGLMVLADAKGSILTKPKYQEIKRHSGNRLRMQLKDKWGLSDDNGKQVIAPIYDEIKDEKNNLAVVMKSGKYGYIDSRGKAVTDIKFDQANDFYSDDEAYVEMDDKAYYIDNQGKILRETSMFRVARPSRNF